MNTSLREVEVLALDVQASGARPPGGFVLELGWARAAATTPGPVVESRVVHPPEGGELPRRVERVTGLGAEDLAGGIEARDAWSEVQSVARALQPARDGGGCPTVIHFARYERPHLRWLDRLVERPVPLRILCTHEIARRLLPELPRRGLRAVAGYFGHPVGEMRRSEHHVAATVAVWRAVVERLEHVGVTTLGELERWTEETAPPRNGRRSFPMPERARSALPAQPGVYRMLDGGGRVLYVGKAASLRQRVRSYFQPSAAHAEHILEMLCQARDVATTVTGSAVEAALEEADAIKRLAPPYNKALRASDREVVFGSRDLRSFAPRPDDTHRLGPLPDGAVWEAMAALHDDDVEPAEALALGTGRAPSGEIFGEGLARFRTTLGDSTPVAFGARVWAETHARDAEDDEDDEPTDATPELTLELQYAPGAERFSPARVEARLAELVARASQLVRRGGVAVRALGRRALVGPRCAAHRARLDPLATRHDRRGPDVAAAAELRPAPRGLRPRDLRPHGRADP